ncbi:MAG: hypothetical protein V4448_14865 [Pseudomonadota bacterium]
MPFKNEIANRLAPHAHKLWAQICLSLLVALSCTVGIHSLGLANLPVFGILSASIICVVFIASFICFYFLFRLPRCPNDTIGFLIIIRTETVIEQARLENDFYQSIRTALNEAQVSLKFKVFLLPARIGNAVESLEQANQLRAQCNMRFALYGDIRTRNHKGKEFYVLRVISMVSHGESNSENIHLLQSEMIDLLPAELRIDCQEDLEGFEITSLQFASGARYAISVALFISGQTKEAVELLKSLYTDLKTVKKQIEIPDTDKLAKLIPNRLTNFLTHEISTQYSHWRNESDIRHLNAIENLLQEIPKECESLPDILTFRATNIFLMRRDVTESKRLIRLADIAQPKSAASKYSLAFLSAYDGDLDESFKFYRTAFSLDESDALSVEVEEFISKIVEIEPDKYQLHFCLGLVNFRKKRDYLQATRDFQKFVTLAEGQQYAKQVEVTQKYLVELGNVTEVA